MDRLQRDAHEDAVTQADGVWVTFTVLVGLYVVLGAALVLTLLAMARRWRAEDERTRGALRAVAPVPPTVVPESAA